MSTNMNNTLDCSALTVAQLAVSHPAALSVFSKHNIDYCCGGHRSLEEACSRLGLDPEKIKQEIYESPQEVAQVLRPENWSSSFLIDFIIENHHSYVATALPEISVLLDKVCQAHASDSVELLNIRENFNQLAEELTSHMSKEELVLFPALKKIEERKTFEQHPLITTIQSPVRAMEHEHLIAGDLIKQIRFLSNNYTPPDFACPTYKITYQKLREFDTDLMRHIHLENNILFERVKAIKEVNACSL
jgi:regulator of cell morphogenesis and NO signaling